MQTTGTLALEELPGQALLNETVLSTVVHDEAQKDGQPETARMSALTEVKFFARLL